ncbi:hypothetical protein GCM10007052_37060 [Halioglobus japonicus]|uniref:PDGLE domain-containing protein n=1 Tax=Halioglobus japonicus TaxID=930805 RepID=A0AAP8SNN7_9GAMM|nr:hypothetical protein C0029_10620 [Halioglobus japonicus]GHD23885.1 hypothetical protein GCM10007052_37060 [Halioglobus japonicus]
MLVAKRKRRLLLYAMLVGLLAPFAYIFFASEGQHVNEAALEPQLMDSLPPRELEGYVSDRMLPMTLPQKLWASAVVSVEFWKIYLTSSVVVGLVVWGALLLIVKRES